MSKQPSRGLLAAIIGIAVVGVLAVVLASVALGASGGEASPESAPATARPSIVMSGHGTATGVPDELSFNVRVTLTRPDVAVAMNDASATMKSVFKAISRQGIARKNMQSKGLSINPAYDYSGNVERLVGYTVSQSARVQVEDLAKAGKTLAVAAAAGGNDVRINGVSLGISDQNALLAKARRAAVADARAKASEYAGASGEHLGRVLTLKEVNASSPTPQPLAYQAAVMSLRSAAAVPIRAGQKGLNVTIQVVWELE